MVYVERDGSTRQVWHRRIAHKYGPRLTFVSDSGRVLMLDEYEPTVTDRAITLLDIDGNQVVSYSTQQVLTVMGKDLGQTLDSSTNGWWISGSPTFSSNQKELIVGTANGYLNINLLDGRLQFIR